MKQPEEETKNRQYDINSKEYQYVKNEIFQGVKNYVDRGYVVMLGSIIS